MAEPNGAASVIDLRFSRFGEPDACALCRYRHKSHTAVDQIAPMNRLETAQIAIALKSVESHHAVVGNDQTDAAGVPTRERIPALEPYSFDPGARARPVDQLLALAQRRPGGGPSIH